MLKLDAFIFNPISENTYVLHDENGDCIIIDPGCSTAEEEDRLFGFIDSHQLHPILVINTHGHFDHVIGNTAVKQRYGVKVAAHAEAKKDYVRAKRQAPYFGMAWKNGEEYPDVYLEDDEVISLGDSTLEVIFTPGHAEGSISLYAVMEGWVFTGDALFCRSIGRTDLPGGNYEQLCESIRSRLFTLPNDTTVYSGHGESSTIGDEKDFNYYVV